MQNTNLARHHLCTRKEMVCLNINFERIVPPNMFGTEQYDSRHREIMRYHNKKIWYDAKGEDGVSECYAENLQEFECYGGGVSYVEEETWPKQDHMYIRGTRTEEEDRQNLREPGELSSYIAYFFKP